MTCVSVIENGYWMELLTGNIGRGDGEVESGSA